MVERRHPRPFIRRTPEQREAAVQQYLDGWTTTQVAAEVGVTPAAVRGWVIAAGHALRPPGSTPNRLHAHPFRALVVEEYLAGTPATELAMAYGITARTVKTWTAVDAPGRKPPDSMREARNNAIQRYLGGDRTADIAGDAGVTTQTLLKWVREAGHPTRPATAVLKPLSHIHSTPASRQAAVDDYLSGMSVAAVASKHTRDATTIRGWLISANVRMRDDSPGRPRRVRAKALRAHEAGATTSSIARACGVSPATVRKWIRDASDESAQ